MFLLLAGMTLVLGIQIFCRFVLNNSSLTWSEGAGPLHVYLEHLPQHRVLSGRKGSP